MLYVSSLFSCSYGHRWEDLRFRYWVKSDGSRICLIYLFLRFAGVSYGRFVAVRFGFNVNVYSEPLVTGRRGEI